MSTLPTGTVTFLFTDIQGNTALGEQHPEAMRHALIRHDALVEQHVAAHAGHVVRPRGEGDSRFAVFARATDAVAAAAALQQALYAEAWPTPVPLRVRIALHTGEADLRDGDYYGSAVNRCARLRTAAHGGQVLLSQASYDLVRHHLPTGTRLQDLGEHRLKDLQHPERIHQLLIDNLPADFAPLRTLDARPHNLPIQRDRLIGREQEVAAVVELLRRPSTGLVTLTGPGGTGKTRLALQVAAELLDDFPDGVWLVELAPTHDPAQVGSGIAAALGLKESGAQVVSEGLKGFLHDKHLLLVLDNFEQVLAASPFVVELLQAAPALQVLVTSRAVLHLRGEREVAVPPLSVPTLTDLPAPAALEEVAAVHLFVERARDAKADFRLFTANARAVAEICVRLDGLPLAIELAAARSKLLAPQALLARLQNRLKLLTGGARDLPTRQQTLRATIDWSFSLLDASEQRLFTRLGVFVGGWTVEAADAVCNPDGDLGVDMLDGLQSLLDKNLLRQVEGADGEPRFRRLETIREYALEQFAASGETATLQELHARHYVAWLEALPAQFPDRQLGELVGFLRTEMGNLAATVRWIADHGDIQLAVRWNDATLPFATAYALGQPWQDQERWRQALLDSPERIPIRVRAKALARLGMYYGDHGDYSQAAALLEAGLALSRSLDDSTELGIVLIFLGDVYRDQDQYARAAVLYEESLALCQALGNQVGIGAVYHVLAELALLQQDYQRAVVLEQASLSYIRHQSIDWGVAAALIIQGFAAQHQGDSEQAGQCFREGLSVAHLHQILHLVCASLVGFATMAMNRGLTGHQRTWAAARAARLLGAVEALLPVSPHRMRMSHAHRREYILTIMAVRTHLGEAAFGEAWAEGQAMSQEQAVAYALQEAPDA